MTSVVGTLGTLGYGGAQVALAGAGLNHPADVAFDRYGNMFIVDSVNEVIRQVTPSGMVYTVAGTYNTAGYAGDGGVSTAAVFNEPTGVAVDASDNIYISDTSNNLLRVVIPMNPGACEAGTSFTAGGETYYGCTGTVYTVAGNCASANLAATETAGKQIANYGAFTSSSPVATSTCSASTELDYPAALQVDGASNVYIANAHGGTVIRIAFSPAGPAAGSGATVTNASMALYAGSGSGGYAGDGGVATSAKMNDPYGIALDAAGNLYISDSANFVIRMVPASGANQGRIFTVAGTTSCTGIPAGGIFGSAVATACASETGGTQGVLASNNGNGGPALNTSSTTGVLRYAERIAVDRNGNLIVVDNNLYQVRVINMIAPGEAGDIEALAGPQVSGHGSVGTAGSALGTELNGPLGAAVDEDNNIYVADYSNAVIRRIGASSNPPPAAASVNAAKAATLEDFAFLGGGDSIPAASGLAAGGAFSVTQGSASCPALYVANTAADGDINGVPGSLCAIPVAFEPAAPGVSTSALTITAASGAASAVGLTGVGTGPALALTPGAVSTVVASGLNRPSAAVIDGKGDILIADTANHAIREVAAGGTAVTTIAGTVGAAGYGGDGGPAAAALLNSPSALALDAAGNLWIADTGNHCIREIDALSGTIATVAGSCGAAGFAGDGGAATAAQLESPSGLAVNAAGDLFIADTGNQRIREVVPALPATGSAGLVRLGVGTTGAGAIHTIAGTGTATGDYATTSGDGGPASAATFNGPAGLALDASGDLFVADSGNSTVRRIALASHTITTVAGTGAAGSGGDGGPATGAGLSLPAAVAVDAGGDLYIADSVAGSLRQVRAADGEILTLATGAETMPAGDQAAVLGAPLEQPGGLALDPNGRIYVADAAAGAVVELDPTASTLSFGTINPGSTSTARTAVLTNIGNQALTLTGLAVPAPYAQQASGGVDCSATATLAAGASCSLQLVLQPQETGDDSGTVTITDNALNLAGSTQTIALSGVSQIVPTVLAITGLPAPVTAGAAQTITVSALNGSTTATQYVGRVHFTSTDTRAVLPADYTYTAADQGVHSFPVTLETAGAQSVNVVDAGNVNLGGSAATTVSAGAAAALDLVSGNDQTGQLSTAYPVSLAVEVVDAYGNAVSGAAVLFTAPAAGAGGTFPGGTSTTTVTTDAGGRASTTLTANTVNGSFTVTATSGALAPVTFNLINSSALPTTLSLALVPPGSSLPYGEAVTLAATLTPSTSGGVSATGTVTFTDACCALGAATLGTATLAAGAASFTDAVPVTGSHSFSVFYGGDATFAPSFLAAPVAFTVTRAAVSLSGPSSSPVSVNVGQAGQIPVSVAGQFSGTNIVPPTGSLSYQIGSAAAATAPIAQGVAVIPVPATLADGSYTVAVSYPGDGNYQAASLSVPLAIAGESQTVTFAAIPGHTYGDPPIALAATATSGLAPVFSVVSGPAVVSGGSLALTGAGTVVVAAGQPGNATYAAAPQVTQSFLVAPAPLTVTASNASRTVGQANPPFTGTVTGAVNGDVFTESFTTTATSGSPAGGYPIVPAVTGPKLGSYAVAIVNGTLTIVSNPAPTVTLSAGQNPVLALTPVTLSAAVGGATGTPTGAVVFMDGSTQLGSVPLAGGVATLTTAALAAGTHAITAVYGGDASYSGATSAALSEVAIGFGIAAQAPQSQTILPGGSASFSLAIAPSSGDSFPGELTLTVTGLPAQATAAVTPSAWTQAGASPWSWTLAPNTPPGGNTGLTIQLPQLARSSPAGRPGGLPLAPLALGLLLLPVLRGRRLGRMLSLVLLAAGGMAALAGLNGCGSSQGFLAQPQQSYPITVTVASGGQSYSATLMLTVE